MCFARKIGLKVTIAAAALALLSSSLVCAEQLGRGVYHEYCHICHGTGMPEVPQFGDEAHWRERADKGMDALYNAAIYGVNAMPPKGLCDECSEQQVKAAVDYMVTGSVTH